MARRLSGSQLRKKHPRVVKLRKIGQRRRGASLKGQAAPPAVIEARKRRRIGGTDRTGHMGTGIKKGARGPQTKPLAGQGFVRRKFEPKKEMPSDPNLIAFARESGMRVTTDFTDRRITHDDNRGVPADEQRRLLAERMREEQERTQLQRPPKFEPSTRPKRRSFDDLNGLEKARLLKKHHIAYLDKDSDRIEFDVHYGLASSALEHIRKRYDGGEIDL